MIAITFFILLFGGSFGAYYDDGNFMKFLTWIWYSIHSLLAMMEVTFLVVVVSSFFGLQTNEQLHAAVIVIAFILLLAWFIGVVYYFIYLFIQSSKGKYSKSRRCSYRIKK